jgi:hypothetical protein
MQRFAFGNNGVRRDACPTLFPEQFCEIAEVFSVQIRDNAVVEAVKVAVDDRVAAAVFDGGGGGFFRGPNEDIDCVPIAAVDERDHGLAVQIIQAAADQGKTLRGEIFDVGRKINFTVEPWFYRVLIA